MLYAVFVPLLLYWHYLNEILVIYNMQQAEIVSASQVSLTQNKEPLTKNKQIWMAANVCTYIQDILHKAPRARCACVRTSVLNPRPAEGVFAHALRFFTDAPVHASFPHMSWKYQTQVAQGQFPGRSRSGHQVTSSDLTPDKSLNASSSYPLTDRLEILSDWYSLQYL